MAMAQQKQRGEIRRKPFLSTSATPVPLQQLLEEQQQQQPARAAAAPTFSVPASSATQMEVPAAKPQVESAVPKLDSKLDSPKAADSPLPAVAATAGEKPFCPDGSDALASPASGGGLMSCGAGFDGHELCPQGYYCSIDHEKNSKRTDS